MSRRGMSALPIFVSLSGDTDGLTGDIEGEISPLEHYAKIYPDPESEKAIMSSVVYCIHHKEGCQWSGELKRLKAHLNACKYDAVACPASCGARIPRVLMQDHLRYTCSRRRAACNTCGKRFSGAQLDEHSIRCERERERAVAAPTALAAEPLLPPALLSEDKRTLQPCIYRRAGCDFAGSSEALEQHARDDVSRHLSLVWTWAGDRARVADRATAALRSQRNYQDEPRPPSISGALVWRIDDFASKMVEAGESDGVEIVSPPFYTSQYGYKLQASLFLNGNGAGEGTHISAYIKLLPGEYDPLLRWPFSHTVTFTLFEQADAGRGACNVTESFAPDPTWENFRKPPKAAPALGFGFPRFVSHTLLRDRCFIKDNVLFLRVKTDPSKTVAV